MAKILAVKTNGVSTATTAGAAVTTQETPFIDGVNCLLHVESNDLAGAAGVIVVQTSPDNADWTTVFTSTAGVAKKHYVADITLSKYIRAQPSVEFDSGTYNVYLTEGIGG